MAEITRAERRGGNRVAPEAGGLVATQVDLLYEQSRWSIPGGLAAALLLSVVLWPVVPAGRLLLWLAFIGVLVLGRLGLTFAYTRDARRAERPELWRGAYVLGAALSGASWAMGGVYVAPTESLAHWSAYLLWLGGLVAGGVAILSVAMEVYVAFALPAILPVAAYLLLRGDPASRTVGAVLLPFLAFMLLAAWRMHHALARALQLQGENSRLARQLQLDLDHHLQVEAQLREANRRAETLARQLRQLSAEDGLTGIANRRHFDQVFLREWLRALRGAYPLSLVLLDLDFFKPFNDSYGHRAGDECLQRVTEVLRGYCRRPGDVAARYGGEEFVVVLPGTGRGDARDLAARIVEAVEALRIPHESSAVGPFVTISAGVATLVPDRNMSPKHLIEMADAALYRAKGEGRNRVVAAGELIAESGLRERV